MDSNLVITLAEWLLFSCCLISFIEHQVHAQLMHRKNFLSARSKKYEHVFKSHAIAHHGHYSQTFTDEPVAPGEDQEIRLNVYKAPIKTFPVIALISLVSWQGALVFTGTVLLHHWIWNKIHLEMHKPEGRGFASWGVYRFLARHHFLHHLHPNKNFNVVFPFADYILGTNVEATDSERLEMYKAGLLPLSSSEIRYLERHLLPVPVQSVVSR